jgi:hypothetical protein
MSADWGSLSDWVSAGSSVVTAGIAVAAICVAKHQIGESRHIAREATATNLYNHCLEMMLEYPMLAEPALSGGFQKLTSDQESAAKYVNFMASLLLSCEEILAVTDNDAQWRASIKATLDGHVDYFRYRNQKDRPLHTFYSEDLMSLIDELTTDPANPPVPSAIKLASRANA